MNRTAFVKEMTARLIAAGYAWTADPVKLATYIDAMNTTIAPDSTRNPWAHDGAIAQAAWKAIGGKGKPTLKALRALPNACPKGLDMVEGGAT